MHPGALKVFTNWAIMINLQKYLNASNQISLLIACANPLQESWHFCEATNILTI